jgi:hypothetical protein
MEIITLPYFLSDFNEHLPIQRYKDNKYIQECWEKIKKNPKNIELRYRLTMNNNYYYLRSFEDNIKKNNFKNYCDINNFIYYINSYINEIYTYIEEEEFHKYDINKEELKKYDKLIKEIYREVDRNFNHNDGNRSTDNFIKTIGHKFYIPQFLEWKDI